MRACPRKQRFPVRHLLFEDEPVDVGLGLRNRLLIFTCQAHRQFHCGRHQLVFSNDAVEYSPSEQLFGLEMTAGEDNLFRPRSADMRGQPLFGCAGTGLT